MEINQKQLNQLVVIKDAIGAVADQFKDESLTAIHNQLGEILVEVKAS